ncbi:response regulator receiver protein [Candidatus Koribacter versatilis Ellin345]|uniref:Response regulator receiver protein n=1 Tax=Koribacter versatilis (strain Ellin345) TaxID=204669 RepID=Q1IHJ6_KORVE|nr:transcriptional regulator [Candidatus Koribacter versatilis]ABF43654.1 response regulator receiver protein [Candidatus Koribacter versatilis Ellin345]
MTSTRLTIATLTADAAETLKRNQMLSASGYRVITPKTPDDILQLLHNDRVTALIVNNSVPFADRDRLLREIRQDCPDLLILHVYHRGEPEQAPWADANVDMTDPARLIVALEEFLRNRPVQNNCPHDDNQISPK